MIGSIGWLRCWNKTSYRVRGDQNVHSVSNRRRSRSNSSSIGRWIWIFRVRPPSKGFPLFNAASRWASTFAVAMRNLVAQRSPLRESGIERAIGKLRQVGIRTCDARGAARFVSSVDPFRQLSLQAPASQGCGAIDPNLRSGFALPRKSADTLPWRAPLAETTFHRSQGRLC